MEKVPPSERLRKEIRDLWEKGVWEDNLLGQFLIKAMQLMMQEFLEAEVTNFSGRGYYERQREGIHRGYRNGYEPSRLKTAEGEVPLEVPQVRDTIQPFSSKLRDFFRGNTDCLEKMATRCTLEGYPPGT